MIRRILDSVYILLFAWACMLLGAWLIDRFIVTLTVPIHGLLGVLLTSVSRVAIGALLVLVWLWLWRELVRVSFRRSLKKNGDP